MKEEKLMESLSKITLFKGSCFHEISPEYRNKLARFKDDNSKFIVMKFDDVRKILESRIKDDYFVFSGECKFKKNEIREVICFDYELSQCVKVEIFDVEHLPSGFFNIKMVLICPPDIPPK
jgi:hypothetical protein